MNTIGKRYGVLAVCSALLIALDQWAKSMAYNTLRVNGPLVLIKGIFELLYSENRGAAFGILQGKQWFFFLVAAAVVIAVLVFVAKLPSGNRYLPLYISMVLLLSGDHFLSHNNIPLFFGYNLSVQNVQPCISLDCTNHITLLPFLIVVLCTFTMFFT